MVRVGLSLQSGDTALSSAKDWNDLAAKMDDVARRLTDPIAAVAMHRMAALTRLRARLRQIRPDLGRSP